MGRPVGILCRCALCDSYFVVELGQVDMATYRGKKGKQALMDHVRLCLPSGAASGREPLPLPAAACRGAGPDARRRRAAAV